MQIDDLQLAFANTGRLVRGVRTEQWSTETPCSEWDLRTLANHTVWVVSMFGTAVHGRPPTASPDADVLGEDPAAAFDAAAADTLAAWRECGFEGTINLRAGEMPAANGFAINVVDTYVHGWDIARATGQDPKLDPTLCGALLDVMPDLLPAVRRGDNFGPALEVPLDAPVTDRLLGFLGRKD